MTDDLAVLIVQTAGQVAGMMFHSALIGIPSGMNLIGTIANPLLLIPYGLMIGVVPIIGTIGSALILMGIVK